MEPVDSPPISSELGTPGISPADLGRSRKRKFSTATSTDRSTREYGLMRESGSRHDTSRFVGSSSGIHFIRGVYVRLARKSSMVTSLGPGGGSDLVPGEDDQLLRRSSSRDGSEQQLWKPHEIAYVSESDVSRPTFEQLVEWSKSYFESWHPTLPFLSAPDVLACFERISNAGITAVSHLEACIVRSILSISLADSRQSRSLKTPIPSYLLFGTIEEAMSASQHALYRPASIQSTQAALSTQLFLISMLRLNSASRLGGLIVRMAFHLGLHRCPARFPFFLQTEAQMRRRIFWCIYSLERFLCQSLGLPLDIRDDDVDVCFPDHEHHGHGASEGGDRRLVLLSHLSKHARIRGLILELRNKSIASRHDTAEQTSYVQAELAKWSNEVHDLIEDDYLLAHQDSSSISPNHRLYLLLLKHESTISLNRPMMTSDPRNPSYAAALQECIFAAKSILGTLRKHHIRYKVEDGGGGAVLSQPMLWPSFTWAVWISSFILVYAAFEGQLPLSVALRHVQSSKDILRHIASRETSWPEYCLSAIDELTAAIEDMSHHRSDATGRSSTRPDQGVDEGGSLPPSSDSTAAVATSRFHLSRPTQTGPRVASQPAMSPPSSTSQLNGARLHSPHHPPPHVMSHPNFEGTAHRHADSSPLHDLNGRTPWTAGSENASADSASLGFNQPVSRALAATSFPSMPPSNSLDSGTDAEGQESMIWFDQLFANAFGTLDYPVLAAAQFDPSIDPIWS